jgi:RNA polymerase sigma-70 factor (ECF subfamily)
MGGTAAIGKAAFAVEEAHLARAAAAGDGSAFASLYERYERRAYNLAYRITGSEPDAADATEEAFLRVMRRLPKLEDREPAFGSCLFTATRNACYDLMEKRPPAQPGDQRENLGGKLLLESQQEVRDANRRLPEHQREALALHGLEELSYDEIAAIMEINRNSVAQLISRARINLRDELHGTALATVAAPSPECERALPLIAAREDGQLEAGSDDDAWLDAHLAGCERCGLGVEAVQAADASYRTWAPIAVVPWLLEETMAKAAAMAGADWSDATAEAIALRADPKSPSGMPPASLAGRSGEGRSSRRRRAIAAAGLAALLLGGGIATVLAGGESSRIPDQPVADTHPAGSVPASKPSSKPQKEKRGRHKAPRTETAPRATTAASPAPLTEAGGSASSEPASSPAGHQGTSGLQPPQTVATPPPKPKSTPNHPPQPAPAPAPTAEAQPPTEPPTEEPSKENPSKGKGPPRGVPPQAGH